MEDVADLGKGVRACHSNHLWGCIVGRREQGDGVSHALCTFQPCFEPFVTLLPCIGLGPVEYSGIRADSKDAFAICGRERAEKETLGCDCVAGAVYCW